MRPSEPRFCNEPGCDVRVILARRFPTGRWRAYEAADQPPFSQQAAGCDVIVAGQAWRPLDLVEDFMVRHELTETSAHELVSGYPFHRQHFHPNASPTEKETSTS